MVDATLSLSSRLGHVSFLPFSVSGECQKCCVDLSENEELWNGDGDGRVLVAVARTENRESRPESLRAFCTVLLAGVKRSWKWGLPSRSGHLYCGVSFNPPSSQLPVPAPIPHPPSPNSMCMCQVDLFNNL